MKIWIRNLTVSTLFMAFVAVGFGQACANFHKRKCAGADNEYFRYNTQSKSGLFELGYTSDLFIVVHAGQDYRVSLCQDKKVEEPIKFKIIESRTEIVLFDNEQAATEVEGNSENGGNGPQFTDFFEFSAASTQKIIIRITAPGPPKAAAEGKKGKHHEPDPEDLFCVGVLVENMPTPKLGF